MVATGAPRNPSPRRSPSRNSPGRTATALSPAGRRLSAGTPKPEQAADVHKTAGFYNSVIQSEGIVYLAQLTGLENSHVVAVVLLLFVAFIFGVGANLACNVVGFVYPMYKSFQAIEATGLGVLESEKEATEEDLERCVNLLMYWVVYTFFTVGEYFSDYL